ncbi:hypothetical protein GCK72_016178 [Caenorhabditis remanei]|uniref:F-box domain-containing protein n=1 Tax=Caenorhabditis remanei TaxID=31234 RepID=A0A6A5GYD5_CAERE|nr:hypothetical protein GCK72_016178 [Caenorhabditis remanei]KAF1759711.1 hypothetical protein GCK72_016178 [Caenorhabditis remanei]
MTEKSIELSELPPEIQQLLVDKCDFITRRRLRASSSLMYQVVNSTKLYIPFVKIKELSNEGVFVKLTINLFKDDYTLKFKKNQTGGTRICQDFRKEVLIENSDPMDEAVDWFRQMCLQKNITIGQFQIGSTYDSKIFTEELDEVLKKSEIPLKIKSIHCVGTESGDLMWNYFRKSEISEISEKNISEIFRRKKVLKKVGNFGNFGISDFRSAHP